MFVEKDKVVTIEYTLKDDKGVVIDSSSPADGREGSGPLAYLHGHGNILPALEADIAGRKVNESIQSVISPENGYGVYDQARVMQVNREQIGGVDSIEIGMELQSEDEQGNGVIFCVTAVEGDTITLDANHDLADVELHFDVKVVGIREALAEELEHGHVHGPGGHHH